MKPRPNILFIMCDQLDPSVLSCYGGPVPTPNIDRLAEQGARLTNAICPFPVCSPCRASMVLGTYVHTHGIVHNVDYVDHPDFVPYPTDGIRNEHTTTEKLLNAAGYQTHHYGKWHLFEEPLDYYPDMYRPWDPYMQEMEETFKQARELPDENHLHYYKWDFPITPSEKFKKTTAHLKDLWAGGDFIKDPKRKAKNEMFAHFAQHFGRLDLPEEDNYDRRVADKTIERLGQLGDEPFFINTSFVYPHDPNIIHSPYYEMFDPDEIELPASYAHVPEEFANSWSMRAGQDIGEDGVREFLRIYYACTKFIDDQIGRILDELEATGRADDTLVIFTSDHGDMCGAHGMIWKSNPSFYREIVSIPFIARYPGVIPEGQVLDGFFNIVDCMPTLLDFCGESIPEHAQGISFKPFLTGESPDADAPKFGFCERLDAHPKLKADLEPGRPGSVMVSSNAWKYWITDEGTEYLFDRINDPHEMENRAADSEVSKVRKTLRAELKKWLTETGYPGWEQVFSLEN